MIELCEDEVQDAGEGQPCLIGDQQPSGDFALTKKLVQHDGSKHPQQMKPEETQPQCLLHENELGPKQIDCQLCDVQSQQDKPISASGFEYEPHGSCHGGVQ